MPEKYERAADSYAFQLDYGMTPTSRKRTPDEQATRFRAAMCCLQLRDAATKRVFGPMNVAHDDRIRYINFGRRLESLRSRMLDGPPLERAIDNAIGEWVKKGLDRAVLLAIAGLGSIINQPVDR